MPTHDINLTDHYEGFVLAQVNEGKFSDASEVMRAGLRLLEQQSQEEKEKLTILRALATDGFNQLDQGQGIVLENAGQLAAHIGKLGLRAAAEVKHRSQGA